MPPPPQNRDKKIVLPTPPRQKDEKREKKTNCKAKEKLAKGTGRKRAGSKKGLPPLLPFFGGLGKRGVVPIYLS